MWVAPASSPLANFNYTPSFGAAPKIIGGTYALPGEFPYQLQIKDISDDHRCGAVLITTIIALTAAHCVYDVTADSIIVVSGKHFRSQIDRTEQSRRVKFIIVHDEYTVPAAGNDIALLVLHDEFTINSATNVALLPSRTIKFKEVAHITGWGLITTKISSLRMGSALKKVAVPLVSTDECRKQYVNAGDSLADMTICAGAVGRDACWGDSGGPLTCSGPNSEKYVCGVVSWGRGCGEGFPTIYTNLADFQGWIGDRISELRAKRFCTTNSRRCTINYSHGVPIPTMDPCLFNEFHCKIADRCIPIVFRCDEDLDCGSDDPSDESGCPFVETTAPTNSALTNSLAIKTTASSICSEYEFECLFNWKCIPLSYKCDGDLDCGRGDNSDEMNCPVPQSVLPAESTSTPEADSTAQENAKCESDEFLCLGTKNCIGIRKLCDGISDCGVGDVSDEVNCTHFGACTFGEFRCNTSGECIRELYKCDGNFDCGLEDRTDEDNCTISTSSDIAENSSSNDGEIPISVTLLNEVLNCNGNQFECHFSKKCIPLVFVCDEDLDCGKGDNSDETNC
ncbi:unnamed protein product [Allacma fusca]|uniref:Peptidase S1 domain-containing protein n=1 Tax=Allacma fusca TaxID=39272 RepID=A0A8J2KV51_9HEXA|nr:unnamed protein product [Allacma fusca]